MSLFVMFLELHILLYKLSCYVILLCIVNSEQVKHSVCVRGLCNYRTSYGHVEMLIV